MQQCGSGLPAQPCWNFLLTLADEYVASCPPSPSAPEVRCPAELGLPSQPLKMAWGDAPLLQRCMVSDCGSQQQKPVAVAEVPVEDYRQGTLHRPYCKRLAWAGRAQARLRPAQSWCRQSFEVLHP